MALTQPQLLAAVADRAELPKAEAKRVLDALEEVVEDELGPRRRWRPRARQPPTRRATGSVDARGSP